MLFILLVLLFATETIVSEAATSEYFIQILETRTRSE